MRLLLLTPDGETERRYIFSAAQRAPVRLTVLKSEAQAMERLYRDPFDALLLDVRQRRFDWAQQPTLCPQNLFLLLSPNAEAQQPSVVYGFLPPCSPETVLDRIALLSVPGRRRRIGEAERISAALQEVGVPTHLSGFPLWKDAVRLALQQPPTALRMREDIYAPLAAAAHTGVSVTEHAMRHAIDAAWLRADARVLERLFGYTVSADRATPSNEAFLFQMCEHIRIQQKEGNQ